MPKHKVYRCRHCGHEADKKADSWQHIRMHVRPEKLLACDACQFVTEYKHHLEYHKRHHSGVKPFKCDKCDYQCVNMSMLKSHLKSHSSLCPYQCGVCKYATKYAHSLKMHLKKYNHQSTDEPPTVDMGSSKRENREQHFGHRSCDFRLHSDTNNDANTDGVSSSSRASSAITSPSTTSPATPTNDSRDQPLDQQCILDLRIGSKLHAIRT